MLENSYVASGMLPQLHGLRILSHMQVRRLVQVDPDRLSAFAAPSPGARLVARGLLRAFHRLRPELREILSLAATGLSSHEIAASLSLPRPTVATRLRLARRLFARALTRSQRWPR
ncbi:Bipartite response regulator related protein [Sorangium cellulosum So ce56]|uniref:Bipartite response regulator related protein n=2 Tax=Sorangium cellulosum TaxID=56 RepID=A9F440_SORC5|nr:Bipartite response regulator related protein [Sorangium cellulosum So ce56]